MPNAERLIEVFNEAKARPAGPGRDQFLADACGDDLQMKEQVTSLLRADDDAGEFLEKTIPLQREIEAEMARFKPEQAGDQIGAYTLREQIGEGGFGVVWVAEQEKPVRRTVALKIIKLGMDTRDVVARFEQERQALAMMDHPNIARVFDAGVTDHGRPFFVMELVHGVRITEYCDKANLPTVERLKLFISVCHAVQHAHQKGIIHRDLKPSNILVTLHDGVPVPKVIDFGVAKATQGRVVEQTIHTQFHQMIGTPLYMSPEQVELGGLDVDTRADIYVLGVLLYELLTGRTPFDAKVLLKAGYDEMRRVLREQEPQRPSTALTGMTQEKLSSVAQQRGSEPPKLIHAIRGDLDWIAMKCLEKDRTRRYETVTGLALDVQRHLDNEPVMARPPSTGYRFWKLVRRHRAGFAAAAAIAGALVVGFASSTWMYFRESDARKRARHAEELATKRLADVTTERDAKEVARQEAEAIATFMTEVFQSPDPMRDGRTITVAETLDRAAQKLETNLSNQPARRAMLQGTLGKTYHALGLYSQAIPLKEKTLEYHRAASGPEDPRTLSVMHSLASSYIAVRRLDEALKLREEALALRRKVLGPEHPETLWAMHDLANSYFSAGRRDEALKLREEVLPLRRKALGPEHPETLWAMHGLADSYFNTDRRDEALKLREEVLALRRKVLGPEHPDTLWAKHDLADSYFFASRRDEALKLREEVLPLRRKVYGSEHPHTLGTMHDLADSYFFASRRDEALKLYEEALPLRRKVLGPEHPETLGTMHDLAKCYLSANRWDEALKLREEVLQLRRKVLGPEHLHTLRTMHDLADSYFSASRRDEALKLREEVLPLRRKALGPEHPETIWAMHGLAVSYLDIGRRDEAIKLREEVLELRRKVLGPEHPDTLWAMHNLATSYHDGGRVDEARTLREEMESIQRKSKPTSY